MSGWYLGWLRGSFPRQLAGDLAVSEGEWRLLPPTVKWSGHGQNFEGGMIGCNSM
jgi:hypothetical protein